MNGYWEKWSVTWCREHNVNGIILPAAYANPDDGWKLQFWSWPCASE